VIEQKRFQFGQRSNHRIRVVMPVFAVELLGCVPLVDVNGLHAQTLGALDISQPVVADVDRVGGRQTKLTQRCLKRQRMRLDPADIA